MSQSQQSFGASAPEFLNLYPHANDAQAKASAEFVVGDRYIAYKTWKWADLERQSGKTTAYIYFFKKGQPAEFPLHVPAHGAEVLYAFDNLKQLTWGA